MRAAILDMPARLLSVFYLCGARAQNYECLKHSSVIGTKGSPCSLYSEFSSVWKTGRHVFTDVCAMRATHILIQIATSVYFHCWRTSCRSTNLKSKGTCMRNRMSHGTPRSVVYSFTRMGFRSIGCGIITTTLS